MKNAVRTAEILCVGTELLLGDIINTNAAYLSRKLAELGICVYHQSVVGDSPERLTAALDLALSRSDLVITSGGLGPTYDDLTRETVAAAFGLPLEPDADILNGIRAYFERMGRTMTQNNERQAMVPRGATVLENTQGTAPGLIVCDQEKNKTVVLLPGPPRELEPMVERSVVPYLRKRSDAVLISKNVYIFGMGESAVENELRSMMTEGKNPTVAPYCKAGEVRLRVTARAENEQTAAAMCDAAIADISASRVGARIYAVRDAREGECSMEEVVVKNLIEQGKTVATAESCTGGLVAKRLTDVAGSSAAVRGGFITYTNEMKAALGVSPDTLNTYSEYSEQTAAEMARAARIAAKADIAVSTTGVAGPGGASANCPVGTVFVGISTPKGERAVRLALSPDRSRDYVRTLAATHALDLIRRALRE